MGKCSHKCGKLKTKLDMFYGTSKLCNVRGEGTFLLINATSFFFFQSLRKMGLEKILSQGFLMGVWETWEQKPGLLTPNLEPFHLLINLQPEAGNLTIL